MSRWEFDRVCKGIPNAQRLQEWRAWHLFHWVAFPEQCLDNEIALSCIQHGTSAQDEKYNFVYRNEFATLKQATDKAKAINVALGYNEKDAKMMTVSKLNPLHSKESKENESKYEEEREESGDSEDGSSSGSDSSDMDTPELDQDRVEEAGLVIDRNLKPTQENARQTSDVYIRPGAHVVVGSSSSNNNKSNNSKPRLRMGIHGEMVDPTLTVHVRGCDVVKQCILHAHKELQTVQKVQNTQTTNRTICKRPTCNAYTLALAIVLIPPVFCILSPWNTLGAIQFVVDEHGNDLVCYDVQVIILL